VQDYFRSLVVEERPGAWAALQRAGLRLASLPYAWGVRLRNRLYDQGRLPSYRAPVPVVSVGNLTLGGTGKTPCVEYIARFYLQLGQRVAILSRGYGGGAAGNDEARMLATLLPQVPHYQGGDRVALALRAVAQSASQVLILDDGFQHRRLARDLDVVLIDASAPWGGGRLFPRGLLREPLHSLRRADVVLLSRCDQVPASQLEGVRRQLATLAPEVPLVETVHEVVGLSNAAGQQRTADWLRGRPAGGFCGLGNPQAFRRTLEQLGAALLGFRTFPDHHRYTSADLTALAHWADSLPGDCVLVTTQKDLVKIPRTHLGRRELWAVCVRLRVRAGQAVLDRLLKEVLA
jgi:tetraacyldisaccharide 4'-kinase